MENLTLLSVQEVFIKLLHKMGQDIPDIFIIQYVQEVVTHFI